MLCVALWNQRFLPNNNCNAVNKTDRINSSFKGCIIDLSGFNSVHNLPETNNCILRVCTTIFLDMSLDSWTVSLFNIACHSASSSFLIMVSSCCCEKEPDNNTLHDIIAVKIEMFVIVIFNLEPGAFHSWVQSQINNRSNINLMIPHNAAARFWFYNQQDPNHSNVTWYNSSNYCNYSNGGAAVFFH